MAFVTKYSTTIEDWEGDTWLAEIQENGFVPAVAFNGTYITALQNIGGFVLVVLSTGTASIGQIVTLNSTDNANYPNVSGVVTAFGGGGAAQPILNIPYVGASSAGTLDGIASKIEYKAVRSGGIMIERSLEENIKESEIAITNGVVRIYAQNWELNELMYATDRQYIMNISVAGSTIFRGWVLPSTGGEEYYGGPYVVQITANCSLGDLKEIPYLDDGVLYDSFRTQSQIIYDCLEKIDPNQDLTNAIIENCDIYGAGMTSSPVGTNSPLDQSYIHTSAYGQDVDDVLSCWDVLRNIMQANFCRFFMDGTITDIAGFYMQKIDVSDQSKVYRLWDSAININTSYTSFPLLAMKTDLNHVNGAATLRVMQGFKEIKLNAERGTDFSILLGENFEAGDFPTLSSLTNWGTLTNCKLISTWSTATISLSEIGDDTYLYLGRYTEDHTNVQPDSAALGLTTKVRITQNSVPKKTLATTDWVAIEAGLYRGIWKVTNIGAADAFFDIDAEYVEDDNMVEWKTVNNLEGIETNYGNVFGNDISLVESSDQLLTVDFDYNLVSLSSTTGYNLLIVVMAWKSATDYKLMDENGRWIDYNALSIRCIQESFRSNSNEYNLISEMNGKKKLSVQASLSSNNNFYTTGSPDLYVGLFNMNGGANTGLYINSIKVACVNGADKMVTVPINAAYNLNKEVDFFHTDGDDDFNDEYRHNHPIYNDATPKRFFNSWQQNGGTADNLEDIYADNLAAIYNRNSQIWTGYLKGAMQFINTVQDPNNYDRIFQLQRLVIDAETGINDVTMIEKIPEGYKV